MNESATIFFLGVSEVDSTQSTWVALSAWCCVFENCFLLRAFSYKVLLQPSVLLWSLFHMKEPHISKLWLSPKFQLGPSISPDVLCGLDH